MKFISKVSVKNQDIARKYHEQNPLIEDKNILELKENQYWYNDILWYGLAIGKTHQRASLVGSYDDISKALNEYAKVGISYFVLTADPNLEELVAVSNNIAISNKYC